MPLAVNGASATSHGKAHDGPVTLVSYDPVFLFDGREELLEEEILIVPSRHVEISVPDIMGIGVSGIRHYDYHLLRLSAGDKLVCNKLHRAVPCPGLVSVAESVEQIDDRVLPVGLVEAAGEIYIVFDIRAEDPAMAGTRSAIMTREKNLFIFLIVNI